MVAHGQNFSGQWKGTFTDSDGLESEYVLELYKNGLEIQGFSYTFSSDYTKKYYSVCKVEALVVNGQLDVKETERTKTNIPFIYQNCFQQHILKMQKDKDGNDVLKGTWSAAPGQKECGSGVTILKRQELRSLFVSRIKKELPTNKGIGIAKVQQNKNPSKSLYTETSTRETVSATAGTPPITMLKTSGKQPVVEYAPVEVGFAGRAEHVIKTIVVESETVFITLVDNGIVDGDSISVSYNGKIINSKQRLTDKKLSYSVQVEKGENSFTMHALNLGSIPPNTALMTVQSGNRNFEFSIESDLNRSGTVRIIRKE